MMPEVWAGHRRGRRDGQGLGQPRLRHRNGEAGRLGGDCPGTAAWSLLLSLLIEAVLALELQILAV